MQSLPLNSADSESTRATLVGASIELVVRLSPAAQAVLNALTPDLGVALSQAHLLHLLAQMVFNIFLRAL